MRTGQFLKPEIQNLAENFSADVKSFFQQKKKSDISSVLGADKFLNSRFTEKKKNKFTDVLKFIDAVIERQKQVVKISLMTSQKSCKTKLF